MVKLTVAVVNKLIRSRSELFSMAQDLTFQKARRDSKAINNKYKKIKFDMLDLLTMLDNYKNKI